MTWKVTHACVRGSSHVRAGLPNQDSALCIVRAAAPSGPAIAIAAVADGHGSARHFRSQIGSSLAVSTAVTVLQNFLARLSAENGAAKLTPFQLLLIGFISGRLNEADRVAAEQDSCDLRRRTL